MLSFREFLIRYLLPLACGFVMFALAADLLWTRFVLGKTKHSDVARIRQAIESDDHRMPIHGSSKARSNYIPSLLGVSSYNYGMDASSQAVSNALMECELAKRSSSAPILVDFPLFWFEEIGDETKFIPFARLPQIRELLTNAGKWRVRYLIAGVRYYGCYDWYLKDLLTEIIELTRRVEDGFTYRLTPIPWSKESFDAKIQKRLHTRTAYHESAAQRDDLEVLIAEHPERHFFVVVSPFHKAFFQAFSGIDRAYAFLDEIGKRPNVTVIDLSRSNYPDNYFEDASHLNEEGAKRFSADLALVLGKHPLFVPRASP